jgi:hypothetical protein
MLKDSSAERHATASYEEDNASAYQGSVTSNKG